VFDLVSKKKLQVPYARNVPDGDGRGLFEALDRGENMARRWDAPGPREAHLDFTARDSLAAEPDFSSIFETRGGGSSKEKQWLRVPLSLSVPPRFLSQPA